MQRLTLQHFFVLMLCFTPWRVFAQDTPEAQTTSESSAPETPSPSPATPAEDPRITHARALYQEGEALFTEAQYTEAEAKFQEAYAVIPNPVILLALAASYEKRDKPGAARAMLRRYLKERENAPDTIEIESRIAALIPRDSKVSCASDPEGATITVEAIANETYTPPSEELLTPSELTLPAGEYTITLTLEGHEPYTKTLLLMDNETVELMATLETLPAAEPTETTPDPNEEDRTQREPTTEVWVLTGIAGGTLVLGSVFGFLALSEQSNFDLRPNADNANRGETFALLSDLSFAVAIGAGATALVLHLTASDKPKSEADAKPQTRAAIVPILGPHATGLSVHIRF